MAATKSTEYTLEQVAEANTPGNLCIVLHGKGTTGQILTRFISLDLLTQSVYNVSPYLDDHPGGRDALMEVAGTDASADFDFVGHSRSAIKRLADFEVGSLRGYSAASKRAVRQQIQQLGKPLSSAPMLKDTVKRILAKGTPVLYVGVFFLLLPALYYATARDGLLFRKWSGIAASERSSLALIMSTIVFAGILTAIGWRFWHRIFHYKDVFAYPPHFTLS